MTQQVINYTAQPDHDGINLGILHKQIETDSLTCTNDALDKVNMTLYLQSLITQYRLTMTA